MSARSGLGERSRAADFFTQPDVPHDKGEEEGRLHVGTEEELQETRVPRTRLVEAMEEAMAKEEQVLEENKSIPALEDSDGEDSEEEDSDEEEETQVKGLPTVGAEEGLEEDGEDPPKLVGVEAPAQGPRRPVARDTSGQGQKQGCLQEKRQEQMGEWRLDQSGEEEGHQEAEQDRLQSGREEAQGEELQEVATTAGTGLEERSIPHLHQRQDSAVTEAEACAILTMPRNCRSPKLLSCWEKALEPGRCGLPCTQASGPGPQQAGDLQS